MPCAVPNLATLSSYVATMRSVVRKRCGDSAYFTIVRRRSPDLEHVGLCNILHVDFDLPVAP